MNMMGPFLYYSPHAVEPWFRLDKCPYVDTSMVCTITCIMTRRIRLAKTRLVCNTSCGHLLRHTFIAIAVVLTQRSLAQPEVGFCLTE